MKLSFYIISAIIMVIAIMNFTLMGVNYLMLGIGNGLHPIAAIPAVLLCLFALDYYLTKAKEVLNM